MSNSDFILYVKLSNVKAEDGVALSGMVINFGPIERKTTFTYEEIIQQIDKAAFLDYMQLDLIFKPEDIAFVTKEVYETYFPDEEIEEGDAK